MFCFQCEQTAQGKSCSSKNGVCGKAESVALLQDNLTGALVTYAQCAGVEPKIGKGEGRLVIDALFATLTNVNFDEAAIKKMIADVHAVSKNQNDFDMAKLWNDNEDIRSLKSLILFGIRGIAAYAYHAAVLGYTSDDVINFLFKALRTIGDKSLEMDELLPCVMETGKVNFAVMELLDKANTESYGVPSPAVITFGIEKGPFIVVSGHDLRDLKLLLEQSENKGINIYTHGEMLPAHGYSKLKAFPHLKGHFGSAWQNQQKDFDAIPAPVLFTTNCLMPVKNTYSDRIFTTGITGFPGIVHIAESDDGGKDFSLLIEKAILLGGYSENKKMTGTNGGNTVTTGFSAGTILSLADKVVDAVKSGAIKHFFLVGGCDGAKKERSYFTEFVKLTPKDTIILTLGCGKFRFNDIDLGLVSGMPRVMDMGQCNDAFGAVKVALALCEAFGCGVNELPLTLVLSWYEQKAVSVLLSLLNLGIKNIYLGPSLPSFVSPNILKYLVYNFNVTPISTAAEDLKRILSK
ncbi:MAG: hydroxylamine reductase [Termitinemataceae bacterium]|nr:MAG: hydroxylamine reductase [Termitinemataceae bacterium]